MDIQLIAVPFDSALHRWRMGAGPEHILEAGLAAHLEEQGHTVQTALVMPETEGPTAEIRTGFELMRGVARQVRQAQEGGSFPLVLSGNCNSSVGTLSGLTSQKRGVFWFDAHGDCHTPDTTDSGFFDGMGLATAAGWGWRRLADSIPGYRPVNDEHILLLGARDLDPGEVELLSRSAIGLRPAADLRAARPLDDDLLRLRPLIEAAYVHCDLDVLDPGEGRANVYPVPGGLTAAEVESLIDRIGRAVPVMAGAITAYAPEYDADGRVARAAFLLASAIIAAASRLQV